MLGSYVTRQSQNLNTDSKTLYHSLLKLIYNPNNKNEGTKINMHRKITATNKLQEQDFLQTFRSLSPTGRIH